MLNKLWKFGLMSTNRHVKTVKSERKAAASASFVYVAFACNDTLIEAKLEFLFLWQNPARIFVIVSNRSSNDSFLDFVFERFVTGYCGSFLKKRSFRKN